MKVEEGNKLIAEFMGMKFKKDTEHPYIFPYGVWQKGMLGHKELFFHSSWDWLMPVVEKIESLGHATLISSHHNRKKLCYETCIFDKDGKLMIEEDFNLPTKIESVYLAIVSFIQSYNTQTPHHDT